MYWSVFIPGHQKQMFSLSWPQIFYAYGKSLPFDALQRLETRLWYSELLLHAHMVLHWCWFKAVSYRQLADLPFNVNKSDSDPSHVRLGLYVEQEKNSKIQKFRQKSAWIWTCRETMRRNHQVSETLVTYLNLIKLLKGCRSRFLTI